MTTETILWIVLYIIFSIWTTYKEDEKEDCYIPLLVIFILTPIFFVCALVEQFIIRKWD